MKYVICKKCSWIHIAKSETEIKEHLEAFQHYIDSLESSQKQQEPYKSFSVSKSLTKQKLCFRCNSSELRLAIDNERPSMLANIQAIIFE